ncbi:MAG: hypothetical protein U0414_05985 [Polyangiaceae bacterium]
MKASRAAEALTLAAALLVAGCSKKRAECERIGRIFSAADRDIQRVGQGSGASSEEVAQQLDEMAQIADRAARELGTPPFTLPELQRFARDYLAVTTEVTENARRASEALRGAGESDPMDAASKSTREAHDAFEAACDAAPDEAARCTAFRDAIQSLPDDASKKTEAEKALAAMEGVRFQSKAVADTATALVASFRSLTRAVTDADATLKHLSELEEKVVDAMSKMEPIVDEAGKFCDGG